VLASLLPGAAHLQNIHPLVVHFPIALLLAAAFLYFLAAVRKSAALEWTALWVIVLGVLSAAVAVAIGLYAEDGVMIAPSVRAALLENHERFMVASSVLAGALTVWALIKRPMPTRGRWAFLAALVLMCALIAKGADYGARMVYDYNAGGDACGQPIDFSR
jgi:uncharacterized membrane protein